MLRLDWCPEDKHRSARAHKERSTSAVVAEMQKLACVHLCVCGSSDETALTQFLTTRRNASEELHRNRSYSFNIPRGSSQWSFPLLINCNYANKLRNPYVSDLLHTDCFWRTCKNANHTQSVYVARWRETSYEKLRKTTIPEIIMMSCVYEKHSRTVFFLNVRLSVPENHNTPTCLQTLTNYLLSRVKPWKVQHRDQRCAFSNESLKCGKPRLLLSTLTFSVSCSLLPECLQTSLRHPCKQQVTASICKQRNKYKKVFGAGSSYDMLLLAI